MNSITPPMPPEPPFDIIEQPAFEKGRRYTLEQMQPIIEGKMRLPNVTELDAERALGILTMYDPSQMQRGKIKNRPGSFSHTPSAIYVLSVESGSGYAFVGSRGYQFSICKHEKISTSTADQERHGWHAGFCKKCGVDMSYDSGD